MATPSIRALRRALPRAELHLLASPWGAPAVETNPDIDRIHRLEATWFEPGRREGPDPSTLIGVMLTLFAQRYEAAADLRGDVRSILIARATGAARRAGFSRIGLENLLTEFIPLDPAQDYISRNHGIVRLLGAGPLEARRPIFRIPERAVRAARELLAALPSGRPIVAVFPGTNRPSATWGASRFAKAMRVLAGRRAICAVLCGREADRAATSAVMRAARSEPSSVEWLDLTGMTDFAGAAAILARSSVALGNDSGASHLAVAVGTPVVSIFGPTDPRTLWTWDHPERYVSLAGPSSCERPCFRAGCLGEHGYGAIEPETVASRLEGLMEMARVEVAS